MFKMEFFGFEDLLIEYFFLLLEAFAQSLGIENLSIQQEDSHFD